jgi:ribosomal protein S18 acetylase RimI-like enzyme
MAADGCSIRHARPDDAPLLAQAEREIAKIPGRLAATPNELKNEAFREKILKLSASDSGAYLVIENEGVIVGHAYFEPLDLMVTSHVARLAIAIHEGAQGMGYGKKLMRELIARATANGKIEKLELHVRSSNERAIALYESLGFQEEGRKIKRLKLAPDHYVDDLYMALWVGS